MTDKDIEKRIDLTTKPKKSYWKLSIPITIFLIFNSFYSIADLIWITQISENAIFAISAASPLLMLIDAIGDSIGQGPNSIMSRCIGSNDYETSYNSLIHGLLLTVIIGIIFLSITPCLNYILYLMGITSSQNLILEYTVPSCIFSVVFLLNDFFSETFQSEGNSKTPVIILICSNIINLTLDPIFIFIFNMGVSGAAYASIVSSLLAAITFIYLYLMGKTKVPLSLKYFEFRLHIIYEILKVTLPNLLKDSSSFIFQSSANKILFLQLGEIGIIL